MAFRLINRRSTGLLDISGELLNGWTGALFVEREGADVYFRGNVDGSAASSDIVWMLPPGFRPGSLLSGSRYDYGTGFAWTSQNSPQVRRINHYFNRFQIMGANGQTSTLNISHHLRTRDAMPTSVPGVRI